MDSGTFLSLKWKMILLLSLVLLTVNGVVTWLSHADLLRGFAERRSVVRDRHLSEAVALQQSAAHHMQRVADMTASIAGMSGLDGDLPAVTRALDTYWASLQLNFGITTLRLFATDGQLLLEFGGELGRGAEEPARVARVAASEQTATWLGCERDCYLAAAAPVLSQGQVAGVVVAKGQLADMIVDYHRLTGVDIGLLAPAPGVRGERALPRLGMRVVGLSGIEANLPVLQQLEGVTFDDGGRGHQEIRVQGRDYDLAYIRVGAHADGVAPPLLVVMEDVSREYAVIRKQALWQLAGNVATSLLALLLLVLLLNNPLERMARAAQAIPLLGRHAFQELRDRLKPRGGLVLWDEIDSLDRAAVTLSYRLEALEQESREHARQISDALKRISVERDFNQGLLDTAQVIILTQNVRGEILTINRYGEKLAGKSEAELQGEGFFGTLCVAGSGSEDMRSVLEQIAAGSNDSLTHECMMPVRGDGERIIAWTHTRLEQGDGREAQILSVGVDITERKHAEARIAYLAEHDPLTGLANRQHFQRKLEQALAMARRSGRGGALLYLDLDGFKYVNDVSGHQAGDALLRMVADSLTTSMRDIDLVGRLGGDEIGVLLQECDRAGAIVVAEKIGRQLEGLKFPGLGANHRVSASIGIVLFPSGNTDVKQVLANADIAMYQAKAEGRARWHLYAEGERMQEKLHRWVYWEERIKHALEHDRFVVHYQPILDIRAGHVSHYEALLRMRDDNGALIAPGEFMEVAEESGLIRQIDRFVISTVLARAGLALRQGKAYKFAINLSGVSINDAGLLDFLRQELKGKRELPQHLIFEITETAAVADFSAARNFMEYTHELGCAFSLDDFGVGFSSFHYVKHLPVDYVKIDGSFIRHLADSPDDQVFVRALAEMARGFGKKTVAEFVENEQTLALLRAFGVDFAQGYFVGKPGELGDA